MYVYVYAYLYAYVLMLVLLWVQDVSLMAFSLRFVACEASIADGWEPVQRLGLSSACPETILNYELEGSLSQ